MITLALKVDWDRMGEQLAQWPKHAQVSIAKALTRMAFDARDAVRETIPQRFTLRRPWIVQGVVVKPAETNRLVAVVAHRDPFLVWQERGGVRGGKNAIPLGSFTALARSQVIPKALWPGSLMKQTGVFVKKGVVVKRAGKSLTPLWKLTRAQPVAPRLGMRKTVRDVVVQAYPRQMERALREALTKARAKR